MKLTTKQLAIFWAGSFAFILIAFYLGFVAGKREGAISVLDQAGEFFVRLERHPPREPYPRASEIGSDEGFRELDTKGSLATKKDREANRAVEKEPAKIDFTGSTLNPNNSQVAVPVKRDAKSKENLKEENKQKFEEIYRGKNLFAPPPSKEQESKTETAVRVVEPVKEEVKVPVKEAPKATVESLRPKRGWYVQIAAATSEKDGLSYYNKIVDKGYLGGLEPASIKNRSFFRVLVGPFPDQNTAMSKRQELKQAVGSSGEPFIRQVQ